VFEPVAGAYACLGPEDRARGVALLDLGLHSSGLVVYDGDALLLAANLPVCADHFTTDVASVFKVTYEDAECLKQQYGCALMGLTSDSTLIEVPSPEGRPPREAKRAELIEIPGSAREEMFLYARTELQRVGMDRSLLEGIVLTGGGAQLTGMWDMAERGAQLPGVHRSRQRDRRLARGIGKPGVDHRGGIGNVFRRNSSCIVRPSGGLRA
jgi:cell division protein FtsA